MVEGKTEVVYFQHLARNHRAVSLEVDEAACGFAPLQMVRRASARKRADARLARRGRGSAPDNYWCVFDVDEHPYLPDALELAASEGINVALTNPCFELWFILHFENQTAYIGTAEAAKRSKTLLGCGKPPTSTALSGLDENLAEAVERARRLDEKHVGDGSPEGANPSSGVWRLVDEVTSRASFDR